MYLHAWGMQNSVAPGELIVNFGKQLKIHNTFSVLCGGMFSLLTLSTLQTLLFVGGGGGGGGYVLSTYSCTQNLHQDSSISLGTSHATTKEGYRYTTSVDIIINNMHHKRLVTYWESQITGNVCNECLRAENNAI